MAITEIIHLSATPLFDDTIHKTLKTPKDINTPQNLVLGTRVQDKGAVQITSEWDDIQDSTNFEPTSESSAFISSVSSSYGEPQNIFHVALNRSAFGPDGPATANVVEYVQSYFPASRVTPEYQKQVEADFLKFDEIYKKGAEGTVSWASGWVLEEQEHGDVKGEKAKCFFVVRGWESMGHFEKSIQNDAYKEAIPLLFAWNAPFAMWHIERKVSNGFEVVA